LHIDTRRKIHWFQKCYYFRSLDEKKWFWVQTVNGLGHKVIISNFWHPFISVERIQLQKFRLCT